MSGLIFVVIDEKDSFNIFFYYLGDFIWFEFIRSYILLDKIEFGDIVMVVSGYDEDLFFFIIVENRLKVF